MAAIMIVDAMIAWVSGMPPWFATVLLSIAPVTESRLTIPIAITVWHMPPIVAYCFAMLGNAIPFFPIFFGFRAAKLWAERRAPWTVQWFERAVQRVQKKIGTRYERWGLFAVLFFVAIPLPGTGVWSGALLAVVLELSWKRAAFAVFGGMFAMGAIVLGLTLGGAAIL